MKQINNYFKLVIFSLALFSSQSILAQCTDWLEPTPTTVWNDFVTTFGGAPCDDGTGCAFNEIVAFEAFAAEAYGITDFVAGNSYAFSLCNSAAGAGMGGQAWNVDFTIIAPSGAIDASGVDADNCTISWTATESGTYTLVINEVGNCGGGPNTETGNGFPAITCTGGSPCPAIPCSVSITDNEDGTATANPSDAVDPIVYAWSNGDMTQTAMNLTDGEMYSVTITDDIGCIAMSSITIGAGGTPCESWAAPAGMGVWNDFTTFFNGAPCDDGTGCPLNEITNFEVFASEAYTMANIQLGGTYTFSLCNSPAGAGMGGQAWIPDFTIIAPSGIVEAFGAGDGDGCSMTWTAAEEGSYTIVINEAGACGGGGNTGTGNGFPAITCSGDTPCPPVPPCFASTLVDNNAQIVCSEGTFSIAANSVTDTVPDAGGYGWILSAAQGGSGGPGGDFNITSAGGGADVYNADLNGILSGQATPVPPLTGTWVFKSFVHFNSADPFNSICSISNDSMFVFFSDVSVQFIFDNMDNTAGVVAQGANPPFTYLWSEGSTTATTNIIEESGNYTVIVTDALGCTAIDDVDVVSDFMTNIEDVESLVQLEINPNPTSGDFNINLELGQSENIQIDLMSITGQKVRNLVNETSRGNMYQITGNELPAGLYFVRFNIAGEQFTEKLIIK